MNHEISQKNTVRPGFINPPQQKNLGISQTCHAVNLVRTPDVDQNSDFPGGLLSGKKVRDMTSEAPTARKNKGANNPTGQGKFFMGKQYAVRRKVSFSEEKDAGPTKKNDASAEIEKPKNDVLAEVEEPEKGFFCLSQKLKDQIAAKRAIHDGYVAGMRPEHKHNFEWSTSAFVQFVEGLKKETLATGENDPANLEKYGDALFEKWKDRPSGFNVEYLSLALRAFKSALKGLVKPEEPKPIPPELEAKKYSQKKNTLVSENRKACDAMKTFGRKENTLSAKISEAEEALRRWEEEARLGPKLTRLDNALKALDLSPDEGTNRQRVTREFLQGIVDKVRPEDTYDSPDVVKIRKTADLLFFPSDRYSIVSESAFREIIDPGIYANYSKHEKVYEGRIPKDQVGAIRMAEELMKQLDLIHEMGCVHNAVEPKNLMYRRDHGIVEPHLNLFVNPEFLCREGEAIGTRSINLAPPNSASPDMEVYARRELNDVAAAGIMLPRILFGWTKETPWNKKANRHNSHSGRVRDIIMEYKYCAGLSSDRKIAYPEGCVDALALLISDMCERTWQGKYPLASDVKQALQVIGEAVNHAKETLSWELDFGRIFENLSVRDEEGNYVYGAYTRNLLGGPVDPKEGIKSYSEEDLCFLSEHFRFNRGPKKIPYYETFRRKPQRGK